MADNTITPKNFKAELKALLKKYRAHISMGASEDSDWFGINGEYMYAYIDDERVKVPLSGDGYVDGHNIKE